MRLADRLSTPVNHKVLPPEINNLLVAWWLALALTVFAALIVWPLVIDMASPYAGDMGVAADQFPLIAWCALGGLAALFLLMGIMMSSRLYRGGRFALRMFRLMVFMGMLIGVAAVGGVVYVLMNQNPSKDAAPLFGPTDTMTSTLVYVLLAGTAMLPFLFGLLGISMGARQDVRDFFGYRCPKCDKTKFKVLDFFHTELQCRATCGCTWTESLTIENEDGEAVERDDYDDCECPECHSTNHQQVGETEDGFMELKCLGQCGFTWSESPGATWFEERPEELFAEEPEDEEMVVDEAAEDEELAVETEAEEGEEEPEEEGVEDDALASILMGAGVPGGAGKRKTKAPKADDDEDVDALFTDPESGIFKDRKDSGELRKEVAAAGLFQDPESGVYKDKDRQDSGILRQEVAAAGLFEDPESGIYKDKKKRDTGILRQEVAAAGLFEDPESGIYKDKTKPDSGLLRQDVAAADLLQGPDSGLFKGEPAAIGPMEEAPVRPLAEPTSEIDIILGGPLPGGKDSGISNLPLEVYGQPPGEPTSDVLLDQGAPPASGPRSDILTEAELSPAPHPRKTSMQPVARPTMMAPADAPKPTMLAGKRGSADISGLGGPGGAAATQRPGTEIGAPDPFDPLASGASAPAPTEHGGPVDAEIVPDEVEAELVPEEEGDDDIFGNKKKKK